MPTARKSNFANARTRASRSRKGKRCARLLAKFSEEHLIPFISVEIKVKVFEINRFR